MFEKRERYLDLFGGILLIILSYFIIYYPAPNYEQLKIIIPVLCAVGGYMIRRSELEND